MAMRLAELDCYGVSCQTTGAQHRGEVVCTEVKETLYGDEDGPRSAVATGQTPAAHHAVGSDMSAAHPHKPEDHPRDYVTVVAEGRFSTNQTLGVRDYVTALDGRNASDSYSSQPEKLIRNYVAVRDKVHTHNPDLIRNHVAVRDEEHTTTVEAAADAAVEAAAVTDDDAAAYPNLRASPSTLSPQHETL